MKRLFLILAVVLSFSAKAQTSWTGTWAAAAEFTGPSDMPKTTLAGKTLREIIQVSIPGEELQLMLSNEFGDKPVVIKSVYIADALDSCDIVKKGATYLKFNGSKNVTIAPGETVTSDVFKYKLKIWQRLSVNICYGGCQLFGKDNTPIIFG